MELQFQQKNAKQFNYLKDSPTRSKTELHKRKINGSTFNCIRRTMPYKEKHKHKFLKLTDPIATGLRIKYTEHITN